MSRPPMPRHKTDTEWLLRERTWALFEQREAALGRNLPLVELGLSVIGVLSLKQLNSKGHTERKSI